jgi:hypothetical protein
VVAHGPISEDEEVRPSKCARPREPDDDDGEARPPKRVRARVPDDDDEEVRQPKRARAGAAVPEGCQVCLRCLKRLHLEVSSTSRGRTVVIRFLCDLGPLRKCSYCTHTKHDCK